MSNGIFIARAYGADSGEAMVAAVVAAIATLVALNALYAGIVKYGDRANTLPAMVLALAVLAAAIHVVSAIGTAGAFAARPALEHRFQTEQLAATLKLHLAERTVRRLEDRGLRLNVEADDLENLASLERKGIGVTGVAGDGAVVAALETMTRQVSEVAGELRLFTRNSKQYFARAETALERMRAIRNNADGLSIEEREIRFAAEVRIFNASLRSITDSAPVRTLEATAVVFERGTDITASSATSPDIRRRQAEGLRRIDAKVTTVAETLRAAAHEAGSDLPAQFRDYVRLGALSLIFRFWDGVISFWAIAIMIELTPILLLLAYLTRERRARHGARRRHYAH